MYNDRLWTMRQYAGFSTAGLTNERFRMLLDKGQTGLSVAFDLPTQLGLDSDDPLSEGEVGKVGVTIDSIRDMRDLFDGIDLSKVSTSMTINAPATTLLALYVAVADEKGVDRDSLRGTVQNDILKEYIARGLYIFPPKQSLRLTTDLMSWCSQNTPGWNTISVSGYHMREAGCTAIEEVAITLSNALEYVRNAVSCGMKIDDFAPRMSFFFACHNNFLEEVSKFRAARKLWHDIVESEFTPESPKSKQLRFHTQTAGATLTAQQPMNNIVRVSYQALSAVLGGTQSLHTNSFDEAIGLPTDEAVTIALRTQQLIANETGIIEHPDPLGGSYLVEEMTSEIYDSARDLIQEIDRMGGSLECIKSGYQQTVIHESAWKYLKGVEDGSISVVGVNTNESNMEKEFEGQVLNPNEVTRQIDSLENLRMERDSEVVERALSDLRKACIGSENVMEPLIHALKSEATVGEVNGIMREVFGTWTSPSGV
jgi:methylmalonyl-CoA mutase N-terminal domain/subunit